MFKNTVLLAVLALAFVPAKARAFDLSRVVMELHDPVEEMHYLASLAKNEQDSVRRALEERSFLDRKTGWICHEVARLEATAARIGDKARATWLGADPLTSEVRALGRELENRSLHLQGFCGGPEFFNQYGPSARKGRVKDLVQHLDAMGDVTTRLFSKTAD